MLRVGEGPSVEVTCWDLQAGKLALVPRFRGRRRRAASTARAKAPGHDGSLRAGDQRGGAAGTQLEEARAGLQGHVHLRTDDLGSYSREVAALEGCGQQRGRTPLRGSQAPSGGCCRDTDEGGAGLGGASPGGARGTPWGGPRSWRDEDIHIREIFGGQHQHVLAEGPTLGRVTHTQSWPRVHDDNPGIFKTPEPEGQRSRLGSPRPEPRNHPSPPHPVFHL